MAVKMKILSGVLLFFVMLIWSMVAIASAMQAGAASPSWFEHVDLMQILIGGLFLLVLWFMVRTIKKIDANQTNLFNKYNNHEKRLSHLEGAHEVRTGLKLSCKVEDDES